MTGVSHGARRICGPQDEAEAGMVPARAALPRVPGAPQAGRAGAGQCGRRCRPRGSLGFGGLGFRPRAWVPGGSAGRVITSPDWSRAGWLRRPGPSSSAERYSRKVQQPAWIPGDACGRRGTVTCTDGLRWTSCRWMACKRSGVRIPVAPHKRPGQGPAADSSGWLSRSPDRHLTVVLGTCVEQRATRIGTPRQARCTGVSVL